jgi:hypothetical protein
MITQWSNEFIVTKAAVARGGGHRPFTLCSLAVGASALLAKRDSDSSMTDSACGLGW